LANFVVFKKLPSVNSLPIGENSPNLVTLLTTWQADSVTSLGEFSPIEQLFTLGSLFENDKSNQNF
jgi:hypothetical protein